MVSVAHFQSLLRIYHKDKEGSLYSLRKFDVSEKVCEAISRGERSISTQLFSQKDVRRLKRMGLQTEDEVDLVVEFPWSFLSIVSKANDTQLRRRVRTADTHLGHAALCSPIGSCWGSPWGWAGGPNVSFYGGCGGHRKCCSRDDDDDEEMLQPGVVLGARGSIMPVFYGGLEMNVNADFCRIEVQLSRQKRSGGDSTILGRIRIDKTSGDISIGELSFVPQ
ncbi:unnamed protein product [Calypogeia fissa]